MEGTLRKPVTAQEQLDMDMMAEAELTRLERQFHIMEEDRKTFTEVTDKKLNKQRNIVRILENEKDIIQMDLAVASSEMNKKKDRVMVERIRTLLLENDKFAQEVKDEVICVNELNVQIKKIEKDVEKLRLMQYTDKHCEEKIISGRRIIETLENRLETVVKKFCGALCENRKLREEINGRLVERFHFNNTWEKLMGTLTLGKKFMMDLIEQATTAYDQREEWCTKLEALQTRTQNEYVHHVEEMREMKRKLDHGSKLEQFLSVKGQRRIMRDLEEKEALKREKAHEEMMRQLHSYKETLSSIKRFTGEAVVSRLAAKYVKQDEENFALFNYVNELNHELEKLTDSISNLRLAIDEQKEINERKKAKQKDDVDALNAELQRERKKTMDVERRLKSKRDMLEGVFSGIQRVFKKAGCDSAPLLDLLGCKTTINRHNVLLYLGVVNGKVSDMIAEAYYKERSTPLPQDQTRLITDMMKSRPFTYVDVNKLVPVDPCPLCVESDTQRCLLLKTLPPVFYSPAPFTKAEIVEILKLKPKTLTDNMHPANRCSRFKNRKGFLSQINQALSQMQYNRCKISIIDYR